MNSDIKMLSAISAGYKRGKDRLEALRVKEIRESDVKMQIASFNGLFEHALATAVERKPYPLSKALRTFLAIDR